jgi:hypothetical protein
MTLSVALVGINKTTFRWPCRRRGDGWRKSTNLWRVSTRLRCVRLRSIGRTILRLNLESRKCWLPELHRHGHRARQARLRTTSSRQTGTAKNNVLRFHIWREDSHDTDHLFICCDSLCMPLHNLCGPSPTKNPSPTVFLLPPDTRP